MARDDYFVIVYQLMKYLYECLKRGEKPEVDHMQAYYYSIPENYWKYILVSLVQEGYIAGLLMSPSKSGVAFGDLQDTIITPKFYPTPFSDPCKRKTTREGWL